uniref:Uncharacterized protein n=1 Tax=Cacopsylla melanoneura TaxID=428564 RepID=A0A8D8RKD3_9HEMI
MAAFSKALESLRVVKTNLEAAAHGLNSVELDNASTAANFNTFEAKFDQVEKGVSSAANLVRDMIEKEEDIAENFDEEDLPTADQLHTLAAECDQFINWVVKI